MHDSAEIASSLVTTLRAGGRTQQFRRGQGLFTEGDRAERVLVVERGLVLVSCLSRTGREVVLGICGPGDVLGEMSALDGEPRSATATAIDDVEVTVAPASVLLTALDRPAAALELIRTLAGRLREGDRRQLEFAALGTLGRVAWRLLELSERFGTADGLQTVIGVPLSQEQLASWCGASREATVKALGRLRALGIVTTSRQRIAIRDRIALQRLAQGRA